MGREGDTHDPSALRCNCIDRFDFAGMLYRTFAQRQAQDEFLEIGRRGHHDGEAEAIIFNGNRSLDRYAPLDICIAWFGEA
ncbi:hypothetical protein ACFB49_27350 [Sphingomonas sp. DBB INV C78]